MSVRRGENGHLFALSGGAYQYLGLLGSQPLALNLGMFADEIASGLLTLREQTRTGGRRMASS